MRKKLLAANWKMHKTPAQATEYVRAFLPLITTTDNDIVLCPAALSVAATVEALKGSRVEIGCQNIHWEREGAFTGEISAEMIIASGCKYVIIGHSERRQYFGETDDRVNHKLEFALEAGLAPIVCVGESLEEHEAGIAEDVIRQQCSRAFRGISGEKAKKLVMAYEPVWAIGTGKTATPHIAADVHLTIRAEAAKALGDDVAANMRILYGGSVKPENAASLLDEPEIDGALVGGASLDAKSFANIVNCVR
jgi:triosephosphate isomerase (TIM)